MKPRILIIDDEQSVCELLQAGLRKRGFDVTFRTSAEAGHDLLAEEDFDAVVTDIRMRGMGGLGLCERIVANRPDVPVLVITAFGSLDAAIAAIRAGAYDFLTKPFELEVLELALTRAIRHRALREEVKRLQKAAAASRGYEELMGNSVAMKKVYALIDRVAELDTSMLVTGESGTGKELVARAIHRRSQRKSGPFVAVNCAAVPESLLESELFGHVKGAFTDAKGARTGLFFKASGGTLFLDEIGDMPLGLQPKLLRALQERRARPIGSDTEIPFDIRVVAATNQDIEVAVEQRRFREDLYYRINVVHIELPPLRSRDGDVLLLAQHFIDRYAAVTGRHVTGLSAAAAEKLTMYSWPGNVRELANCMERAVALARYEHLSVEDLPQKIQSYRSNNVVPVTDNPSELVPMDEVEHRYIARVMEAVQGNKTLAARILGFDRATLYRKLARHGPEAEGGAAD